MKPVKIIKLGQVLLTLCLAFNLLGQGNAIPVRDLQSDYLLLRESLEEAHPGLYRYTSREKMDSLFNSYEEGLNIDLGQREFYLSLLPLMDEIHCGHTKLMPSERPAYPYYYNTGRLFPLKLYLEGDRAFVVDFYGKVTGVEKGAEILSINGESMPVIIQRLLGGIFSDGENTTFKYYELNRYFSAYYADIVEAGQREGNGFSISISMDDHVSELKMEGVSLEQVLAVENSGGDTGAFGLTFGEKGVSILTIPYFWNPEKGPGFRKFLKRSFREINERNTEHLVIDLRNNEGGKEVFGSLLLSYLMDEKFPYYDRLEITTKKKFSFSDQASLPFAFKLFRIPFRKTDSGMFEWKGHRNCRLQKPKKNNYHGQVYVLINGGSFSVASEFASVLQSLDRAVFIGEETGGGYTGNTSGFFAVEILPHSKLELGIPLIGFYSKVPPDGFSNRGVFPDHEVRPSIATMLNGRDEVLEYTLGLIR